MAWITKKLCIYSWDRQEIYLVSKTSWPAVGLIQPPTQSLSGGSSPVVKWPKREANCLPPSSAKLKNDSSYISPDPYAFVVRTGATLCIYILLSTETSCVSSVAPVSKKDERLHPSLCCVMLNTSTCRKTWRWGLYLPPKGWYWQPRNAGNVAPVLTTGKYHNVKIYEGWRFSFMDNLYTRHSWVSISAPENLNRETLPVFVK